jgi:simple sugar transport system substrate-binding protein
MVTHGRAGDPFWGLVKKGAQQAARDFNVALTYQSPSVTNPQAQAAMITTAAQKKPDAMAVTIPDAPVLSPAIRQATSSGIPVVVFNVGDRVYQQVGALTFVGQADFTGGQEAGKAMAAARVRHALCVIHEAQNTALTDRCAGFSGQSPPAAARCRSCTSTAASSTRRRSPSSRH